MAIPMDARRRGRFGGRGRTIGLVVVVVLFVVALSLKGIATFYTDFLWFRSLGLTAVWRNVLGARIVLALIFISLFFVLCWINLFVADRIAPVARPAGPEEELLAVWHGFVDRRARLVRVAVSAFLALIAGAGVSSQWNEWLLFTNAVDFGETDPLYGKDIGFYVFRLPFLSFLTGWLFFTFVMILIVTAVQHYLNGGIRLQVERDYATPQVKAHLSLLLAVLALVKAGDYWLQRYELVFSSRGAVDGATYTDVNVQRPAIYLLLLISLLSIGLLVANIFRRGWQLPAVTVGLWAFAAIVVGGLYPAFVQRFRVEPAQSTKERLYVERNIAATRRAYGIANVQERTLQYDIEPSIEEVKASIDNLTSVRLTTPIRVSSTLTALQGIKDFYKFGVPDLDRYVINGRQRQVVIGVRELNENNEQSWENAHLAFTHGDGVVLAPADTVTQGLPEFLVSGLPPKVDSMLDVKLDRSQIYFGERLGGYAIINSKRDEVGVDSETQETTSSNFSDTSNGESVGVEMGSVVRRAAFALRLGAVDPLISSLVKSDSRIIFKRDVRERVKTIAPFLTFDSNPYPVIVDGRVNYVIDAYTTTNRYPYSQRVAGVAGDNDLRGLNYVRNSVKAVVDAYNGSVTFYAMDPTDPMLKSYRKAFPNLFVDASEMSPTLQAHLRYPTDLFDVQTTMWARYHVVDPTVLLENSQRWDVARDPGDTPRAVTGSSASGATGASSSASRRPMAPYYTQTRLPDETSASFVITRSFSPSSSDNSKPVLTSFMVGKSDLAEYGQLVAYTLNGNQALAPSGVMDAIAVSNEVSQAITLLNTKGQGSQVFFGDLIAVPVGKSLLYTRSLYIQPEDERTAARIEKVIIAVGGRVVMGDTYAQTLDLAFPGAGIGNLLGAPAPPPTGGTGNGSGTPNPPNTVTPSSNIARVAEILVTVKQKRDLANQRFGEGKFAEYGQLQSEIDKLLSEAQVLLGGSSGTSPTTAPTTSSGTAAPTTTSGTAAPTTTAPNPGSSSGATGSGASGERLSGVPTSTVVSTTTRRLTAA